MYHQVNIQSVAKFIVQTLKTAGKRFSTSNSTFLFKPQHRPVKLTIGVSLHLHAHKKPGNHPKSAQVIKPAHEWTAGLRYRYIF